MKKVATTDIVVSITKMAKTITTISSDVGVELRWVLSPPYKLLKTIALNGLVSIGFFAFSLIVGTENTKFLPFAAAVLLLWTFADASLTNQLIFDRERTSKAATEQTVRRMLLAKNLATVVISIPICIFYGILMAIVMQKWSEVIYGLAMALVLIWGWLGISNLLSVLFPFEFKTGKQVVQRDPGWVGFSILYVLPWVMLPVYAAIILLPLSAVRIVTTDPVTSHMVLSVVVLFVCSVAIWLVSLAVMSRYGRQMSKHVYRLMYD